MTIEQALAHAGDLNAVDMDVMEQIEAAMPSYLWIIDGWTDDTGLMEYDEPDPRHPSRLIHCGACGYERVEKSKRGVYADKYPQSDFCVCPFCGERLEVKHVSRGIKHIYHRLNAVFFRRSAVKGHAVVALAARCTRSYQYADHRAPWELEPDVDVREIAVFDPWLGEDMRIKRYPLYEDKGLDGYYMSGYLWKRVKAMTRLGFGDDGCWEWQKTETICLTGTLDEAIEGTPLERSWCHAYEVGDCVMALHMALKYPCVEYMTKLGCVRFLPAMLRKEMESGLINWRGKTMAKVFKLSQARLGQVKGKKLTLSPELCAVLQYVDSEGIPCGIEIAEGVATVCGQSNRYLLRRDLAETLNMFQPSRRAKALKYMAKHKDRRLTAFRDLWRMTLNVGGSLDSDAEAFPKDFDAVHDRLAARVKVKNSAHLDKLIRDNLPKLTKKLGFEFGGLLLRPAASVEEVLREGEQLQHCVGSYADKYARGDTVICVLRRAVDPDRPWRTVEISATTGRVVQDRGLHNDWGQYQIDDKYRAMLALFWEAWGERRRRA